MLLVDGAPVATGPAVDLGGRRAGRVDAGLVDADSAADDAVVYLDGVVAADPSARGAEAGPPSGASRPGRAPRVIQAATATGRPAAAVS